jgi:hypothetical protein
LIVSASSLALGEPAHVKVPKPETIEQHVQLGEDVLAQQRLGVFHCRRRANMVAGRLHNGVSHTRRNDQRADATAARTGHRSRTGRLA